MTTTADPTSPKILRPLREAADLSQEEVARRAGISPALLSQIETNGRRCSVEHFVAIMRAIDELVRDRSGAYAALLAQYGLSAGRQEVSA